MNIYSIECPICLLEGKELSNENFLCFVCGIICCDNCSKQIDKCPICRASINLTINNKIKYFDELLKRDNYGYLYFAEYKIATDLLYLKNYVEAVYWMEASAMLGFNLAQYMMGYIFIKGGIGLNKNINLAFEWFKLSEENNYKKSATILAYFYLKGLHVNKNMVKAKEYFIKAANNNDTLAQNNLANIYNDRGDFKEALKWYKEGAKNGCVRSKYMTGVYYEYGWGMWKKRKNKAFRIYKGLSVEYVKLPLPLKDMQIDIIREVIIGSETFIYL